VYWTDIQSRFDELIQTTRTLDDTISDNVGQINELKEEINEVLVSRINVITGTFAKMYQEQLHRWGFQKEK
jgi:hypothetical protein